MPHKPGVTPHHESFAPAFCLKSQPTTALAVMGGTNRGSKLIPRRKAWRLAVLHDAQLLW